MTHKISVISISLHGILSVVKFPENQAVSHLVNSSQTIGNIGPVYLTIT